MRTLISPKEAFRIGMSFKFVVRKGIRMMIYGYPKEDFLISSVSR